MGNCLAERLNDHLRLSQNERDSLDRLEEQERAFKRGTVVIREHDRPRELFIARSGWLHSSVALGNGGRQVMRLHLAGDIIGLPMLAFGESPETVSAVTDAVLCPFSRQRFATLLTEHPRIGALILCLAIAERVSLADRLASIGRTPARARVGALLCEISARLSRAGGAEDGRFVLPLTQEEIGDATGLTAVHVNRMMRGLAEDGLIERRNGHVRLLDEKRLISEVNYVDRTVIDTGWLPPPR